eukprot:symbB.v1.2.038282.t1/scaffold5882.1/size22787/1
MQYAVFTLLSQLQPAALTPDAFSYGAGFFAAEAAAWEVAVQLQCAMQTVDLGVDVIMQKSLLQALLTHRGTKVEDSFDRLSAVAVLH